MTKTARLIIAMLVAALIAPAVYAAPTAMSMDYGSVVMSQSDAACMTHCLGAAAPAPTVVPPAPAVWFGFGVILAVAVRAALGSRADGPILTLRFAYARPSPDLTALHARFAE